VIFAASSSFPIARRLSLEVTPELLFVFNRPQNPKQIVPALSIFLYYGEHARATW
jgi:hypothetical protein